MNPNTDGNLAALRQYEKEQDRLDSIDREVERLKGDMADSLFTEYHKGNPHVTVDVIDSMLETDEFAHDMLNQIRECYADEFADNRAQRIKSLYEQYVSKACESIADRYDNIEDFDKAYKNFGIY